MLSAVIQVSIAQDFDSSGELPYQNVTCPTNLSCSDTSMPVDCLACNYSSNCTYGQNTTVSCRPRDDVDCEVRLWTGERMPPYSHVLMSNWATVCTGTLVGGCPLWARVRGWDSCPSMCQKYQVARPTRKFDIWGVPLAGSRFSSMSQYSLSPGNCVMVTKYIRIFCCLRKLWQYPRIFCCF